MTKLVDGESDDVDDDAVLDRLAEARGRYVLHVVVELDSSSAVST